ncbi:MAG: leucine-rich repeat protein, partial [Clostridia bacterium]|nr:leucine-rich repeat protein [Clostridia bacterium]
SKIITIIDDSGSYDIAYSDDTLDYMSPLESGAHPSAYALSHQLVSPGNGDQRPEYDFQRFRQDTFINGTTKWYDYNKAMWDFSGDYYSTLKDYMIDNNVAHVVLYAALSTNEQTIQFNNVSYTLGAEHPIFVPIIHGAALPLVVEYGDSFDPNAYIDTLKSQSVDPLEIPVPEVPDEDITLIFGGWYTTPNYKTGTKILEGESVTITSDTEFYAKWIDEDIGSEGLIFELSEDELSYEVAGYVYPEGGEDILRMPLSYEGLPVSGIRAGALDVAGVWQIREVELRSAISNIQEGAFASLIGLTSFSIKNNDEDYYKVVDGVLYTADSKVLVRCPSAYAGTVFTVPASVTRIAKEAFALCTNIIEVQFEVNSQIEVIAEAAFWECDNLTTISLPISLEVIGERAFYESSKLNTIHLEAGTYHILSCGASALAGTMWLANQTGQIILGNVLLLYKEDIANPSISLIIDDNVSTIADGAFSQEAITLHLESITFGVNSSIERIGNLAFNACLDLEKIYIMCERLVQIQDNAFSGISSGAVLYVTSAVLTDYLNTYTNTDTGEVLLDVEQILTCE